MPEATISVVIPTHNRATFLVEALTSVGSQTRLPTQITVVSDMHDEAAEMVCRQFEAASGMTVDYVETSASAGGASSSRNAGAAVSTGEYLVFLDDDDTWKPRFLEQSIASLARSDAALSVAWIEMFMGDKVKPGPAIADGLTARDVVVINPGATGSNMVMRRNVFESLGGFDPDLRMKNDTDYFYRFLKSGNRYVAVEERLVNQRKHDAGQLTGHSAARADYIEAYVRKHRADMSVGDRRHLNFVVHRIRRSNATSTKERALHLGLAVMNYTYRQWRSDRANRNDTEFFAVPSITDQTRREQCHGAVGAADCVGADCT